VFNRFGLALPADRWTEEAARMLVAARYDAALEDAAHAAEVGARLLFGVIGAAKNAAVRNPKAATTTAVIAGLRPGTVTGAAGSRASTSALPAQSCEADARSTACPRQVSQRSTEVGPAVTRTESSRSVSRVFCGHLWTRPT